MKDIKLNKKVFGIVVVLMTIGVALGYYVAHRENKSVDDPIENKQPANDSVTSVNNETPSGEMGARPETHQKDGSIKIVEDFIKSHAQNPKTFQFLEWSELSTQGQYWKVRCKYRGVSSFNAEVTTNAWFYIQNNKVVYSKIISKI
jgi:hypothetical protein